MTILAMEECRNGELLVKIDFRSYVHLIDARLQYMKNSVSEVHTSLYDAMIEFLRQLAEDRMSMPNPNDFIDNFVINADILERAACTQEEWEEKSADALFRNEQYAVLRI
jgi:predicted choloylglycine hydrolase